MTQHLMLDIETFGTSPKGALASIGAILFDPFGDLMNNDNEDIKQFYRNVSLQSSFDFGLVPDGETVQWWMEQEKDATKALFDPKPVNLSQALQEFMDWTQEHGHIGRWWSHGENFDFPILESAYRAVRKPIPWHFRRPRDSRTMMDIVYESGRSPLSREELGGTVHNALDDCLVQVIWVQQATQVLTQAGFKPFNNE